MRLHRLLLLLVLAVAFAGCGASPGGAGGGGADPAQVVPAGSLFYAEAVVRPDGGQRDNVDQLLRRFLGDRKVSDFVDEALKSDHKSQTYAKDIEPWLGQRVGIGVTNVAADKPGFVGAVAVQDPAKARDFVKSISPGGAAKTYKGTSYYSDSNMVAGVVGDYIAFAGNEADFERAVDTEAGNSLGDADRYKTAIAKLPDERLGATYFDLNSLVDLVAKDPSAGPAAGAIVKQFLGDNAPPTTAALTAKADSATVESRFSGAGVSRLAALGLLGGGRSTPLVRDAPAGSWGVFGAADVGPSLKKALGTFAGALGGAALTGQLEQRTGVNLDRDVFSWVGDLSVFVRGTSITTLDGAAVISVTDQAAARAAIPRLVAAARRSGAAVQGATVPGAEQAFSVPLPNAPGPLVLAMGGDRVVLAIGEQAAAEGLKPSKTIGDTGLYDRAKGAVDGIEPSFILDAPTVVRLIGANAGGDPGFARAQPYLDKLDLLVTGSEKDGDGLRSLFTVKAK
ncbi:MAG: DUF3352 domain-containing protein [Solirubrobacteraceae bacterium]